MSGPAADSMSRFVAEVQEVVLCLRDEGLVLSAIDQHVLSGWWDAGYPTSAVLETLWTTGRRLKARKHPPRGLPLLRLDKAVRKAGEAARLRAMGRGGPPVPVTGARAALSTEVENALHARGPGHPSGPALVEVKAKLSALPEDDPQGLWVGVLFAAARDYYDQLVHSWSESEQHRFDAEIDRLHGAELRLLDAETQAQSRGELLRRAARAADPVLDPELWLERLL